MSTAVSGKSYGPESVPEYATHITCGSIVEICEIEGETTFTVYCPTCQDHVRAGELSGDEDRQSLFYLVRAPEVTP